MSTLSSHMHRVFDRSEATLGHSIPIRKTVGGIWVPTPLRVNEHALTVLGEWKLLTGGTSGQPVVDAGTGDGRVACALASLSASLCVYAVELDPVLCAQASTNLESLTMKGDADCRVHLLEGDYCDPDTYRAGGLDFREVGLVLNYPDGNEERLATFIRMQGSGATRLCLLTHDRDLEVEALGLLAERDIALEHELAWRVSLYGPS